MSRCGRIDRVKPNVLGNVWRYEVREADGDFVASGAAPELPIALAAVVRLFAEKMPRTRMGDGKSPRPGTELRGVATLGYVGHNPTRAKIADRGFGDNG